MTEARFRWKRNHLRVATASAMDVTRLAASNARRVKQLTFVCGCRQQRTIDWRGANIIAGVNCKRDASERAETSAARDSAHVAPFTYIGEAFRPAAGRVCKR